MVHLGMVHAVARGRAVVGGLVGVLAGVVLFDGALAAVVMGPVRAGPPTPPTPSSA